MVETTRGSNSCERSTSRGRHTRRDGTYLPPLRQPVLATPDPLGFTGQELEMKPLKLASILMVPVAGMFVGYGTAVAGPGNSDAAHGCLQGPQIDYYTTDTGGITGESFVKFFEAANHGECVSVFAMNKDFSFVKAIDVATP